MCSRKITTAASSLIFSGFKETFCQPFLGILWSVNWFHTSVATHASHFFICFMKIHIRRPKKKAFQHFNNKSLGTGQKEVIIHDSQHRNCATQQKRKSLLPRLSFHKNAEFQTVVRATKSESPCRSWMLSVVLPRCKRQPHWQSTTGKMYFFVAEAVSPRLWCKQGWVVLRSLSTVIASCVPSLCALSSVPSSTPIFSS